MCNWNESFGFGSCNVIYTLENWYVLESLSDDGLVHRTLMEQREMRWSPCLLRSEIRAEPGKRKTLCFSGKFSCNEKCSVAHWKLYFCRCNNCYPLSPESDKWTRVKHQLSQKHLMSFLVRVKSFYTLLVCVNAFWIFCFLRLFLQVLFLGIRNFSGVGLVFCIVVALDVFYGLKMFAK